MREAQEHIRTITIKGQVTIPIEIRRLLGVKPHDRVVFRVVDNKVELQSPPMSLEDTFGAVPPLNRPENFQALRDIAIEERVGKLLSDMES
jgi:AbrB family looped-hinge helix DNA binding protein